MFTTLKTLVSARADNGLKRGAVREEQAGLTSSREREERDQDLH